MLKLMVICALAVPLFAAAQEGGQATVVSGNASNMALPPGMIVLSDPPLVHTPSVTLDAAPLSAGHGGFATLTWYGPGTVSGAPEEPSAAPTPTPGGSFVNVGVGTSEYSEGVAKLMTSARKLPYVRAATIFGTSLHLLVDASVSDATIEHDLEAVGLGNINISPIEPSLEDVFVRLTETRGVA